MRILIAAGGSYGDTYPFLAIGREMMRRGHEVRFFATPNFAAAARGAGLPFVPVGTTELYESLVHHPDAMHPRRGPKLIARLLMEHLPAAYAVLDEHARSAGLIIGSTLALAARLVQETRGVPTVTVHLQPAMLRSSYRAPRVTASGIPDWYPPSWKRLLWWLADTLILDPAFCPSFNRFRTRLGLPPVKRLFGDWIHQADGVIGLFPDWFGVPQPDWPRRLRLTSFPLYDQASDGLPAEVEAFLDAGDAPVVFTAGTSSTNERAFFRESVEACRRGGRRGILLARYPEQIPSELPDAVRYFEYAPFSTLLPRTAAIVHHGGVGTLSQGLAAGVPQLVRPMAYDQFDNAHQLEELGVARVLLPKRYRASTVATVLEELTRSSAIRNACKLAAGGLTGLDPVAATCDLILEQHRSD